MTVELQRILGRRDIAELFGSSRERASGLHETAPAYRRHSSRSWGVLWDSGQFELNGRR